MSADKKETDVVADDAAAKDEKKSEEEKPRQVLVADGAGMSQAELINKVYGLDEQQVRLKPDAAEKAMHAFWGTQPVVQDAGTEQSDESKMGEIETRSVEQVRKEPYELPAGFEWAPCDMNDEKTVTEVYDLLCKNYVEDDDNMFRFDYSREFLAWALRPPGYLPDLHVCVRVASGKRRIVGFITGVPASMRVHKQKRQMVEINFLCVHKKLRSKRLAPVLIKEITRRVNLTNVWQAVYTAGVVLPTPMASNRYWHRSLNPKKLIDVGFSRLQPRMTMARTIKLYRVAERTSTPGLRPMRPGDVPAACRLLNDYLARFKLRQHFTEDEFAHWLGPVAGVVHSYVVQSPKNGKITDLVSFYSLPSTIIGHPVHSQLRAAYSFYNVAKGNKFEDLMADALILAKQEKFDVFNALDVMDNKEFLQPLKFGIGDGNLQYYLYNWRCPRLEPNEVGLVLL